MTVTSIVPTPSDLDDGERMRFRHGRALIVIGGPPVWLTHNSKPSRASADEAHRAIVDRGTVGCQDGFGNVTQDTKRTATSSGSVKFTCHTGRPTSRRT